jgi:chaperone required for assembly of F1-ATPase
MVGMSKAKMEAKALPKRFYKEAALVDGRILLDGKELKTQGRNSLVIPSQPLAEAVVAEWNAQTTHINPDAMPLTRLVNVWIDRAALDRAAYETNIVGYVETDLLCYRDPQFAAQQAKQFDPVLAWATEQGIALGITDGYMPVTQPEASVATMRALVASANNAEITALAMLVPLLGSAVLGIAVWKGHVSIEQAMVMARLDENLQAQKWGKDEESEALWAHKQNDMRAAAFFLTDKYL